MQKLQLRKKYEVYPEYKDSDIEWLGKIPKEWETGKVKEVFNLLKERSFNNSEEEVLSLTLNGIKTRDVSNNEGQIAASYEGYRKIIKGDIVLNPMDLVRGFVDASKYEGIISPAYSTLRKKDKKTNSQYYNYFFQKHYFEGIFHPFGNGVSVDHRWTLKDDTLVNFPVLTISLEQQTKITNFLDKKTDLIDKIIEKKKKQIELLKEKRTAVVEQAVTKGLVQGVELVDSGVDWIGNIPDDWEIAKLKYRTTLNKYTLPENTDQDYTFKYLDIGEVSDGKEMGDGEVLKFSTAPSRARRIVKTNDSIIATVRTYLKAVGFFESIDNPTIVSTGFAVLTPGSLLNPKYLNYYLKSARFINEVIIRSTGVSYPAITPFYLISLPIIYPSIQEQLQIVKYLDDRLSKINLVINRIEASIGKLSEFKLSLISNVVTGKVKVW